MATEDTCFLPWCLLIITIDPLFTSNIGVPQLEHVTLIGDGPSSCCGRAVVVIVGDAGMKDAIVVVLYITIGAVVDFA